MKKWSILFFVLLIPLFVKSQSVEGTVRDKNNGKPIDGAVVVVFGSKGNSVAYKLTDAKGFFRMTFGEVSDSLRLRVSYLGYASQIIPITRNDQKIDISLQSEDFQLKEVIVKPSYVELREDTIAYSVTTLQVQSDRNIGDVLKRIPGVAVSKTGGITYQGESINKFYIEGLDLLEQKYGIATNNVPVDAIATVEVIENHQPINLLKGRALSTRAAINLKLKKDKKFRPVGTAEIGAGSDYEDLLWSLNIFGLQVAPKRQTIVMYKTNNRGDDITLEFEDQQVAMIIGSFQPVPRGVFPSVGMRNPPLGESRYLFNNSHVLTLNNLWKTKEDAQLRLNVNYINDHREESVSQLSSYYMQEDSLLLIEEFNLSRVKNNILEAVLSYMENTSGHYFSNTLKGVGKWSDQQSNTSTQFSVNQRYELPDYYVRNDLNYLKRNGERIWNINSFIRYTSLPQKLTVQIDTMDWEPSQEVLRSGLQTNTNSSFSYKKGLSTFRLNLNLDASFDDLSTDLFHYLVTDTFRNDLHDNYLKAVFSPQYTIGNNILSLSTDANLVYHWLDVDDKLYDATGTFSIFHIDPSVRLVYRPGSRWTFLTSYSYSHSIGNVLDFANAYILSDYRSMQMKSGELAKNKSRDFSLRAEYKDPLNGFYLNAFGRYSLRTQNQISHIRFVDQLSVSGNQLQDENSDLWMANGSVGKNFYQISTNVSLSMGYHLMNSERWQQGNFYPFSSSTLSFNPAANVRVNRHFQLNYQGQFVNNRQSIERSLVKMNSSRDQITQTFKAYYFPKKELQIKVQAEYLNNEITSTVKSEMFFLDLGISYSYKQLEFTFDWNNIFNEKEYSYVRYSGLDSYSYNYKLRPTSLFATITFKY